MRFLPLPREIHTASALAFLLVPAKAGVATEFPPGSDDPSDSSKMILEPAPARRSLWTVGGGYAHRFHVEGSFSGLGGQIPGLTVPEIGSSTFGEYDDGFVRPDLSGDLTSTTFWGYQNDLQYHPIGGGSLNLSITSVPGSASVSDHDGGGGFDLFTRREMGMLTLLNQPVRWGLQGRFNYSNLDFSSNRTLSLDLNRVTDGYPLSGVIPPLAPYNGSFNGPGPLIGTDATRSILTIPNGALVSGSRSLEADLFAFSFGFWSEMTPLERLAVSFEAGLTLAIADGDFSQRSTTNFGTQTATTTSSASETDLLPGFYLGVGAGYVLNDDWSIFSNLRYEYLDDFSVKAGPAKGEMSFTGSFVFTLGASYQF